MHVLIVDDEAKMRQLIALYMKKHNIRCDSVASGAEALAQLAQRAYDVVLLDVMMPEMDGWQTCRLIRDRYRVPIIMLTALQAKTDVVRGLTTGADDYIAKPFDEEELIARIRAVVRRSGVQRHDVPQWQWLTFNEEARTVHVRGNALHLTKKEYDLLWWFSEHPSQVFSRDQLIEYLWPLEANTLDRTIDSHIRNLRDKLRAAHFPVDDVLQTVWGVGYKWLTPPSLT